MARNALLALALAAGVAGAAAFPVCEVGTTATVQANAASATSCTKFDGTGDVTFTVSSADAMHDVWVLVWNIDQVAGYGTTPTLDGASNFNQYNGHTAASTPGVFGYTLDGVTAGTHTINLGETAGIFSGVLVLLNPPDTTFDPVYEGGAAVSFSAFMPWATGSDFAVHADFANWDGLYQVESVAITVTGTPLMTPSLTGWTAESTATADGVTTLTNVHSGNPGAMVMLSGVDITSSYVDWTTSPFVEGTAQLTSVTEYPTLGSDWVTTEAVTATPQIWMVRPGSYWTNFSVISSVFVDGGDKNDGAGSPSLDHVRIGYTHSGSNGRTYSKTSFAPTNHIINSAFQASPSGSNMYHLGGGQVSNPGYFFVMVVEGSPSAVHNARMNIKLSLETIGGECPMGYSQCNSLEDDHPSSKKSTSANGEASRMRSCIVIPSVDDVNKPTTKCIECSSDCDCDGGQYCHMDKGFCLDDNGNHFLCDSASYGQFGICVSKDPAENILGASCRSDSYLSSSPNLVDTRGPALIAESVEDALTSERSVSGGAFCGQALYFNSTPPSVYYSNSGSRISPANTARAVLWQGECINHVCQECRTGDSTCDSICIQGRWMPRLVVDFTSRTYDVNSLAGTMLAATLMIVLLQLCTCVRIMQAHRAANPKPAPIGNKV